MGRHELRLSSEERWLYTEQGCRGKDLGSEVGGGGEEAAWFLNLVFYSLRDG